MLDRKYLYLSGAIVSRDPRTMYDEKEKPFLIHSVVDGTEAELSRSMATLLDKIS